MSKKNKKKNNNNQFSIEIKKRDIKQSITSPTTTVLKISESDVTTDLNEKNSQLKSIEFTFPIADSDCKILLDDIVESHSTFHGKSFLLEPIVAKILEEYSILGDVKIICRSLLNYILQKKSLQYNNILIRNTENRFELIVIYPEQKMSTLTNQVKSEKQTRNRFFFVLFSFVTSYNLYFKPDLDLNFSLFFMAIAIGLYVYFIKLNNFTLTKFLLCSTVFIPIYGVVYFIARVADQLGVIFFKYDNYLDMNLAFISFIISIFILLYCVFFEFTYKILNLRQLSKLGSKKLIDTKDLLQYISDDHTRYLNLKKIKEMHAKKINAIFMDKNKPIDDTDLEIIDVNKVYKAKFFLLVILVTIISYSIFVLFGPIHNEYFNVNKLECNLIEPSTKISSIRDNENNVLVLRDEKIEGKNLVYTYKEYINENNYSMSLLPHTFKIKYIYKEQCNKIK